MPSRSFLRNYLADQFGEFLKEKKFEEECTRSIDCPPYISHFFPFISICYVLEDEIFSPPYAPYIAFSQMTKKCAFVVLVLSLVISTVLCQTFQYSRGWTNGKRSEFSNSLGVSNPGDERFTNGELKRLKMLVYGSVDEPVSFRMMEEQYT